jgi:peptidyl-prolyl cis-trans isomerase D
MFDVFRKHTKIMMVLLFLLVIPSFVLFGIDGYNRMNQSVAVVARIGSIEITQSQWDAAHKNEVDRLRSARPNLDIKQLDSPEAHFATLERMIRDRVMGLAADKSKLVTSDLRLARFLQEDQTIAALRKTDGKLDMDKYRQLTTSQGFTPEGFENTVRQDISKQQVEAGLHESGFATPGTVDVALNAFFEQREVQIVNFLTKDYLGSITPTDADLEAFYKANESMFKAPEQAHIEYVLLDLESIKKGIKVSDADLKSYYDQNAVRLSGNEERRASHILINVPKDGPTTERQKARAKAEALLKAVQAKPDNFADLAKKNSQDSGSALKGGDLDFFGRGAMVKPFEDAVFVMKKGDISGIVESDFGYHIIQLTDIKAPKKISFDELRPTIERDIKTQQAQRKYAEVAELFTNTVYEQSDSLQPVADKLGLEIKAVDKLSRQPAPGVQGVLASQKFLSALFLPDSIEKRRNTEAIETAPNQLVAGRVVSYNPVRTLPLTEVIPLVRERVIAVRASELANKDGNEKLTLWRKDPAKAVLPTTVIVSRDQPNNPIPAGLVTAALRADAATLPAWQGVDLGVYGFAVLRVNKVVPKLAASRPSAQQDRDQYVQWWTAAERQAYFATLKERFKVEVLVAAPTKNAISQPAL